VICRTDPRDELAPQHDRQGVAAESPMAFSLLDEGMKTIVRDAIVTVAVALTVAGVWELVVWVSSLQVSVEF
jgi:hypothetical protein